MLIMLFCREFEGGWELVSIEVFLITLSVCVLLGLCLLGQFSLSVCWYLLKRKAI